MKKIIITSMDEITPELHNAHTRNEHYKSEVTPGAQKYEVNSPNEGNQTVVAFYTLPPGKSAYPFHYHTSNEEVFYIISGSGILETSDENIPVRPGCVMVFPVGKTGAHKLTNTGDTDLVYLDYDVMHDVDVAFYPDSGKIGVWGMGINQVYRTEDQVGYYEGE